MSPAPNGYADGYGRRDAPGTKKTSVPCCWANTESKEVFSSTQVFLRNVYTGLGKRVCSLLSSAHPQKSTEATPPARTTIIARHANNIIIMVRRTKTPPLYVEGWWKKDFSPRSYLL